MATSTITRPVKVTGLLTIPVGTTAGSHVQFNVQDIGMTSSSIIIGITVTNTLQSVCQISGYTLSGTVLRLTLANTCEVSDAKVRVAFI